MMKSGSDGKQPLLDSESIQFRATDSESGMGLFGDDHNSLMDSLDKDDMMGEDNLLMESNTS